MEEQSSNTPNLPAGAQKFIEHIARKSSWRRGIRKEVHRELTAHFEDALSAVAEAEKDAAIQGLIKDFGDPALLTALIGRGKRRCQPWWERAALFATKAAAVLIIFGVAADIVLSKRSAEALREEIARIRSAGAPTSVQEVIAQTQQNNGGAAGLSREDPLKRCQATALLYEIGAMSLDTDTMAHGKSIQDVCDSAASVAQLLDTWDSETAKAVDETLTRNREAIEKAHTLAALPLDEPADILWFQTEYRPERSREMGLPDQTNGLPAELERLTGPENLIRYLDVGTLLSLDAWKAMKEQQTGTAMMDAMTAVALSTHVSGICRTVVGTLVAVVLRQRAMDAVVQPLLNRADVPEETQTRFLDKVAQMNCDGSITRSMAWERLFLLNGLKMIENGEHVFAQANGDNSLSARLLRSRLDPLVLRARLLPFLHNNDAMVALDFKNRLMDEMALPYPEYKTRIPKWKKDLKNISAWQAPVAKMTLPNLLGLKDDITACGAHEDLMRAAFALRRFKLARGAYPDTLQALTPTFLCGVPNDRFTGKPLLYRKEGEGCVFYSAGMNLRDDGGGKNDRVEDKDRADDIAWNLTR